MLWKYDMRIEQIWWIRPFTITSIANFIKPISTIWTSVSCITFNAITHSFVIIALVLRVRTQWRAIRWNATFLGYKTKKWTLFDIYILLLNVPLQPSEQSLSSVRIKTSLPQVLLLFSVQLSTLQSDHDVHSDNSSSIKQGSKSYKDRLPKGVQIFLRRSWKALTVFVQAVQQGDQSAHSVSWHSPFCI